MPEHIHCTCWPIYDCCSCYEPAITKEEELDEHVSDPETETEST